MKTNNQPLTLEKWKERFLSELAQKEQGVEDIFQLLDLIHDLNDTTDPTVGLCLLINSHLVNGKSFDETRRRQMASVVDLIGWLNRVKSSFFCLDINHDFVRRYLIAMEGGQERE